MSYQAALIGVSGVGELHGDAYESVDGIDLACIADVDGEQLHARGEAWDVPANCRYTDHRELLDTEDIDVVSVATPTPFHRDHTIDAATIGDPPAFVLCEKPIARSVTAASEMVEICEEHGVGLAINHSRRWAEELVTIHQLVAEEGLLGEVRSMASQWPEELLRNGTHVVDLCYHLSGTDPESVSGYLSGNAELAEDIADSIEIDDSGGGGHVVFENGAFATIDATMPRETSALTLAIVGTEGKIAIDFAQGEIRYWDHTNGSHVETDHPDLPDAWRSSYAGRFEDAIKNIVSVLDGTERNRSPGSEAVEVMEILVGFFLSQYTGSRVSLPLDSPLRDVRIETW